MASMFENIFGCTNYIPASTTGELAIAETIYNENRHRLYALSFWMADNELIAEELMQETFRRAFQSSPAPTAEALDCALIAELRELAEIGQLTLECGPCTQRKNVRRNTRRVHLERAVVQLPATEKLIFLMHDVENYEHARISRCLALSEEQSRRGLHQARLRIRELLAEIAD